jgi:hypothetical protein
MHITEMHLGKGLDVALVRKNEENALVKYPALQKAQCQLFKNNIFAIKMAAKKGFKIIKSFKSGNSNILDYLSFDEKLLMEKNY